MAEGTLRVRDGIPLRGGIGLRGVDGVVVPPPPPSEPLTAPVFWVKYDGTTPSLTHKFGGGVLPAAMTDITDDLISAEWSRGGSNMLIEVPPGTATLRLKNQNRQWEPGYAAGPHHPMIIGETFVIGCTWLEADYTLFYGFSESVNAIWDRHWADVHGEVEIRLVDASTLMQQGYTTSSPFEEIVSVRVTKVLDKIGFPAAMRNISASGSLCKKHFVLDPPVTALEYIHAAVGTGGAGRFWIDRRGYATYNSGTSTGLVFGDDNPTELKYRASNLHIGRETQVSKATVTPILGVAQTGVGQLGGGKHTRLSLNRTDAEALSNAQGIASGTLPKPRLEGFSVMPGGNEDLWSAIIPLDLRQAFTVRRRPPGGGTMFTQTSRVEGLHWQIQGHPYETVVSYDLVSTT